mgnify:CR=1 FL=1
MVISAYTNTSTMPCSRISALQQLFIQVISHGIGVISINYLQSFVGIWILEVRNLR